MARTLVAVLAIVVLGAPAASSSSRPADVSFLTGLPEATVDPLTIVCAAPADGARAAVRALLPAGRYVSFAWSPDGSRIAVVRRVGTKLRLETMFADGSARRRVAEVEADPRGIEVAWAPNGKLLAFAADGSLFVARPDASLVRLLVRTRSPLSGRAANPRWTPDGRRIVFVWRWVGPVGGMVVSIRPSGTDRRASARKGLPLFGSWSRDGRRVAFVDWQSGRVVVASEDGTDQQAVSAPSAAWAETPVWSPDGTSIAFARRLPYRGWPAPPADVYVVGADGSMERPVAKTPLDERAPGWRPGAHAGFGPCEPPSRRIRDAVDLSVARR